MGIRGIDDIFSLSQRSRVKLDSGIYWHLKYLENPLLDRHGTWYAIMKQYPYWFRGQKVKHHSWIWTSINVINMIPILIHQLRFQLLISSVLLSSKVGRLQKNVKLIEQIKIKQSAKKLRQICQRIALCMKVDRILTIQYRKTPLLTGHQTWNTDILRVDDSFQFRDQKVKGPTEYRIMILTTQYLKNPLLHRYQIWYLFTVQN
jgi:hypothetical protein